MKLWTSGEVDADVGEAFRATRNIVQERVNGLLSQNSYGNVLDEWAYMAIISTLPESAYGEVAKYRPKKREVEFRLRIPHGEFRDSSEDGRCALFLESLIRSAEMMQQAGIEGLDIERLVRDLRILARNAGWSRAG